MPFPTVEEFQAAYAKLGAKPKRGTWFDDGMPGTDQQHPACGCGAGVYLQTLVISHQERMHPIRAAANAWDVSELEVWAFTEGFDSDPFTGPGSDPWYSGYEHHNEVHLMEAWMLGRAVAKAVGL